jgi:DNA primase large subunit
MSVKIECFKEGKYLGWFYADAGLSTNEIIELFYRNFGFE